MTPPHLRILMTTDAVGGVWFFAADLARALCERGCEVLMVTQGPPPRKNQCRALWDLPNLEIQITDLPLEWMDSTEHGFSRSCQKLKQIEKSWQPHVIHLNSYREALADWDAPTLVTAHSCVQSWWQACRGSDLLDRQWTTYIEHVSRGLTAANKWVAPSNAFRRTIEELYRPPLSGFVIYNGSANSVETSGKKPIIFAAGRLWDEAKNVTLLARIAEHLPWPVELAGAIDGPDNHKRSLDRRKVILLGELPRNQLQLKMREASVFAAPALYEPFGLSVLEAAAAGCALVLSDIPTFRELWEGAALFANPNSDEQWRKALMSVVQDDDLRKSLQRRARKQSKLYKIENTAAAYLRLYETLTERKPANTLGCLTAYEACP